MVCYGDIVVLLMVIVLKEFCDGDFFLLIVNYEEKMYVVGKIFGGFKKREGCFGDDVILIVWLIDRLIRFLFFKGYKYDV